MKQMTSAIVLVCGFALAMPLAAQAQAPTSAGQNRMTVNVNIGLQTGSRDATDSGSSPLYEETMTFTGARHIGSGAFFDISGDYLVWKSLSFGIGYSRFGRTGDESYTAVVPHPIFFDQPRVVTGVLTGLKHTESAVHILAVWRIPATPKIDLAIMLGPSFYSCHHDVLANVSVTEGAAPYTTVTVTPTTAEVSKSAVGAIIGVDGTYRIVRHAGVGAFARWSGAHVKLPLPSGQELAFSLGGFQAGAGVRLFF